MNHFGSFAREQDLGWKSCSRRDDLPPLSYRRGLLMQETMIGRPLSTERDVLNMAKSGWHHDRIRPFSREECGFLFSYKALRRT
jgi:hypothetical protein